LRPTGSDHIPSRRRPAPPAGAALWAPLLDRASTEPLSRQLATALRQAAAEWCFGAGARLPSTRSLAAELGIARSTVVAVFEQLAAEGYLVARQGSGYFVAAPLVPARAPPPDSDSTAAARAKSRYAQSLLLVVPEWRKSPRPFEIGYAEVDNHLIASWKRLASRVLSAHARLNWDYGDPRGEPALREAIAQYLAAARGVRCRPEQIVVTSGTQQGLSLAVRILVDPGDPVWVEDPCYRAAVEILRAAQSRIVPVPVDSGGLDVAAGRRIDPAPPQLIYTTPSRQYPLGMAMPIARRRTLLDWAERAGSWIVEDDYESEFQQPGRALPSLQGLDRAGRVVYLGTFSKLLFPSLRLGYAVLPDDLIQPFAAARYLADRHSSGLLQGMMTEFILGGHFARHLKRMRAHYRQRREFLTDLLMRRLRGVLQVPAVESGMYMTAALPPNWSDRATAAALAEADVVALPLSAVTLATPRPPGLILGCAGHSEAALASAVERMAAVFNAGTGMINPSKLELPADQSRS
jgi:GntR family transcriptional regulator / MocR family aminotransferase